MTEFEGTHRGLGWYVYEEETEIDPVFNAVVHDGEEVLWTGCYHSEEVAIQYCLTAIDDIVDGYDPYMGEKIASADGYKRVRMDSDGKTIWEDGFTFVGKDGQYQLELEDGRKVVLYAEQGYDYMDEGGVSYRDTEFCWEYWEGTRYISGGSGFWSPYRAAEEAVEYLNNVEQQRTAQLWDEPVLYEPWYEEASDAVFSLEQFLNGLGETHATARDIVYTLAHFWDGTAHDSDFGDACKYIIFRLKKDGYTSAGIEEVLAFIDKYDRSTWDDAYVAKVAYEAWWSEPDTKHYEIHSFCGWKYLTIYGEVNKGLQYWEWVCGGESNAGFTNILDCIKDAVFCCGGNAEESIDIAVENFKLNYSEEIDPTAKKADYYYTDPFRTLFEGEYNGCFWVISYGEEGMWYGIAESDSEIFYSCEGKSTERLKEQLRGAIDAYMNGHDPYAVVANRR